MVTWVIRNIDANKVLKKTQPCEQATKKRKCDDMRG